MILSNLSLSIITISSAIPTASKPFSSKLLKRPSITKDHNRGERTLPCGHPYYYSLLVLTIRNEIPSSEVISHFIDPVNDILVEIPILH